MATEQRLDLIDRNAFAECLERMTKTAYPNLFPGLLEAIDYVKDFPTIEARPVVYGRWLFDRNTERYFCSVCNEEALYTSKDDPIFDYDWEENLRYSHTETILEEHLTDYCPNCGAQMDGGADNG